MTNERQQESSSKDEMDMQALIERWAKAVREENLAGVRADHDSEMLTFDVPAPFLLRGLDAYMATREKFWTWSEKPVAFDFHDVKITAGNEVAFATEYRGIPITALESASNPRKRFDEKSLEELAAYVPGHISGVLCRSPFCARRRQTPYRT